MRERDGEERRDRGRERERENYKSKNLAKYINIV